MDVINSRKDNFNVLLFRQKNQNLVPEMILRPASCLKSKIPRSAIRKKKADSCRDFHDFFAVQVPAKSLMALIKVHKAYSSSWVEIFTMALLAFAFWISNYH